MPLELGYIALCPMSLLLLFCPFKSGIGKVPAYGWAVYVYALRSGHGRTNIKTGDSRNGHIYVAGAPSMQHRTSVTHLEPRL